MKATKGLEKHLRQSAHQTIVQDQIDLARLSAIINLAEDFTDGFMPGMVNPLEWASKPSITRYSAGLGT